MSKLFNKVTATISRPEDVTYTGGVASTGTPTPIVAKGNRQPWNGEDNKPIPEGDTNIERHAFYTKTQIKRGDIAIFSDIPGKTFIANDRVQDWTSQGLTKAPKHYKAIFTLMEA